MGMAQGWIIRHSRWLLAGRQVHLNECLRDLLDLLHSAQLSRSYEKAKQEG
jgi:hypothetical protein